MTEQEGQPEALDFEENLARLEEVVKLLEEGNLPLEKSLQLYEEGINAYRRCHRMLQDAEGKIKKLVETLQGELKEEPFKTPGQPQ